MPRTTLDLDAGVLRALKQRRRTSGKSIGQIASELLAGALDEGPPPKRKRIGWRSARMGARVDLDDKEAVRRALDSGR
jgi:hypothetical protein